MSNYYPVIVIDPLHHGTEARGSRRKAWVKREDGADDWLLKFPRVDTGEHWAEKVAAEIGRLVNIRTAHVELAVCQDELATICRSFLRGEDVSFGSYLGAISWESGSDFLASAHPSHDVESRWTNRAHNVKGIIAATIEKISVDSVDLSPNARTLLHELADYVLLDGLIGNTDRHHDNWMVAILGISGTISAAPSFDHASSLGRELTDDKRQHILETGGIWRYLMRGRGGVFVGGSRRVAPAPLHLVKLLHRWQPKFFDLRTKQIAAICDRELWSIVDRIPPSFISDIAKEFAYRILVTSKTELARSIE